MNNQPVGMLDDGIGSGYHVFAATRTGKKKGASKVFQEALAFMERRAIVWLVLAFLFVGVTYLLLKGGITEMNRQSYPASQRLETPDPRSAYLPSDSAITPNHLTLFLCGDVMVGRGIDQVLPHPVAPRIYESYVKDAREYVGLAERKNGPITKPVDYAYIWGDALQVWEKVRPDVKIINLETSITVQAVPWPEKEVQYRMHPDNVGVLTAAGINICILANNHTLDWGRTGLLETMQTLREVNIAFAGAGQDLKQAQTPAVLRTPKGRVILLAYSSPTSGTPYAWAATPEQTGVNLLADLSQETLQKIAAQVKQVKQPADVVVFSVHWGSNWGYNIPPSQRNFAHQLIDKAGVDLVFGHSSHHPRGIEVYRNKLIIYGAGDFINDYEGISGHEQYRGDLSLMYFPQMDAVSGKLIFLLMVPMRIKNFRLNHVSPNEAAWLADRLAKESIALGADVGLQDNSLILKFNGR
jgi:poly-gamma-glutamate capsule biosynthesis protein CapA/YwtB (metallophosphatase superfamily)